jgi:hypothetical protein
VGELLERSPLLPDAALRQHWRELLPWLSASDRYELVATLLAAQAAVGDHDPE